MTTALTVVLLVVGIVIGLLAANFLRNMHALRYTVEPVPPGHQVRAVNSVGVAGASQSRVLARNLSGETMDWLDQPMLQHEDGIFEVVSDHDLAHSPGRPLRDWPIPQLRLADDEQAEFYVSHFGPSHKLIFVGYPATRRKHIHRGQDNPLVDLPKRLLGGGLGIALQLMIMTWLVDAIRDGSAAAWLFLLASAPMAVVGVGLLAAIQWWTPLRLPPWVLVFFLVPVPVAIATAVNTGRPLVLPVAVVFALVFEVLALLAGVGRSSVIYQGLLLTVPYALRVGRPGVIYLMLMTASAHAALVVAWGVAASYTSNYGVLVGCGAVAAGALLLLHARQVGVFG